MNNLVKSLMGMGGMTDKVIATDFLISAKAGIKNLAFALTETTTSEVRAALRDELENAVKTHENITNYMISKGMYHPSNLNEQLQVDMKITQTALSLAQQSE